MKLQIAEYNNTTYYIDAVSLCSIYLWKDGTLNKGSTGWTKAGSPREMSDAPGYWKSQQEAQQFLDYWMPRKKQLTIGEVKTAAEGCEAEALDCSIEHWKQNVLDVNNARLGDIYCAICLRAKAERDKAIGSWRNGSCCNYCILNNYRKHSDTNCCKEYEAFVDNRTEENAIAMLNKLVLIRNNKYGNPYLEEKKMAKIEFDDGVKVELSKETTERLRKELVKPLKLRHGDIVQRDNYPPRVILKYGAFLQGFNEMGNFNERNLDSWAKRCGYKKIGNVFEDYKL